MWPFKRKAEERSISFQDFWGSGFDLDDIHVGARTAMTLAPVWASVRLIADSIAALPLQTFRKTGDSREKIDTPPLFTDPSLFGGQFESIQRPLVSLLLRGNAYGLITEFDSMGPRRIEWLHPDEVSLQEDETTARPMWQWKGRPVEPFQGRDSPGQLLHIPWIVMPGRVLGLSPISAFRETIQEGILAHRFGREWFKHGGIPSAVLETDQKVDEEQGNRIKQRFKDAVRGREPVVLGVGTEYKPISVNADESQFLMSIKANAAQIASIYGVPPDRVGGELAQRTITYANVEQDSLNLVKHSFQPYLVKLEQHFSQLLPRPQFVKFNVDALVRADLKSRMESHKLALDAGWLTKDEVRELEDLPPLTAAQEEEMAPAPPPPPEEPQQNGFNRSVTVVTEQKEMTNGS